LGSLLDCTTAAAPPGADDGARLRAPRYSLGAVVCGGQAPNVRHRFVPVSNIVASATGLRSETTALAGKVSSGQPSAMLFMIT